MTKSRTITDYWPALLPENGIVINTVDARKLGLKDGDRVKVYFCHQQGGCLGPQEWHKETDDRQGAGDGDDHAGCDHLYAGHGHWATGAADVVIDGKVVKGDPRRATGVHANAAMWIYLYLQNTCMLDPVGGSVSFYDTKVNLIKT